MKRGAGGTSVARKYAAPDKLGRGEKRRARTGVVKRKITYDLTPEIVDEIARRAIERRVTQSHVADELLRGVLKVAAS